MSEKIAGVMRAVTRWMQGICLVAGSLWLLCLLGDWRLSELAVELARGDLGRSGLPRAESDRILTLFTERDWTRGVTFSLLSLFVVYAALQYRLDRLERSRGGAMIAPHETDDRLMAPPGLPVRGRGGR